MDKRLVDEVLYNLPFIGNMLLNFSDCKLVFGIILKEVFDTGCAS